MSTSNLYVGGKFRFSSMKSSKINSSFMTCFSWKQTKTPEIIPELILKMVFYYSEQPDYVTITTTRCSMRETRETAVLHGCKVQSAPTTTVSCISSHAYSYTQQSGRSVKTMNAKNPNKSPIHENADANITCDFCDGDISRFRSRLPHTHTSLARL